MVLQKKSSEEWAAMNPEEKSEWTEAWRAQKKEASSKVKEDIITRKLRLLEQPNSMVLAPRTAEGHLMSHILFGFDRVVNRLRMSAGGVRVQISDVVRMMEAVSGVINDLEKVDMALGGNTSLMYESPDTKRLLAAQRTSYVFVPRTTEGQRVASILKRLDPQLVQLRMTCTDFEKVGDTIAHVTAAIRSLHEVTERIAKQINDDYYAPSGLLEQPVKTAAVAV
ncbi:MAG: hypothetical protein K0B01_07740 [Syntrophobacterales bacterium]|nr:hypothetical protein [Syntrophobacterales bacterium]